MIPFIQIPGNDITFNRLMFDIWTEEGDNALTPRYEMAIPTFCGIPLCREWNVSHPKSAERSLLLARMSWPTGKTSISRWRSSKI
jgi:hypothetical protein